MDKVSMSCLFPSQDTKPNDQALKQWLTGRKRGEGGNTKI